jgi:hypothetical protein
MKHERNACNFAHTWCLEGPYDIPAGVAKRAGRYANNACDQFDTCFEGKRPVSSLAVQ